MKQDELLDSLWNKEIERIKSNKHLLKYIADTKVVEANSANYKSLDDGSVVEYLICDKVTKLRVTIAALGTDPKDRPKLEKELPEDLISLIDSCM